MEGLFGTYLQLHTGLRDLPTLSKNGALRLERQGRDRIS